MRAVLARWRATWVAYCSLLAGISVSVWANVAHAPEAVIAKVMAGFMPCAVLLAVELLAAAQWRAASWRMAPLAYAGTVGVAALAGVVSYRAMHALLLAKHEDAASSWIAPLVPDGLMFVATLALLAAAASRAKVARQSAPAVRQWRAITFGAPATPTAPPRAPRATVARQSAPPATGAPRVDEGVVAQIRQMRQNGKAWRAIASATGVPESTARRAAKIPAKN